MTANLIASGAPWMDIVEAAHAPVDDDRAWATRMVEAVRPVFARSPLVGMFIGEHDAFMRGWRSMLVTPGRPDMEPAFLDVEPGLDTAVITAVMYPRTLVSTHGELARQLSPELGAQLRASMKPLGIADMVGIILHPHPTMPCVLWAAHEEEVRLSPHERRTLAQIGLHLDAALRLRHRPETIRGELTSEGRIRDAAAIDSASRTTLEHHGRRVALARSRSRRSSREALDLWSSLVAGEVSLVPRARGRTGYDILENPPPHLALRVLSAAEAATLALAARGLSSKLVAYALGVAPSVVSARLASASAKLGTASRTELIRVAALLDGDRRASAPIVTLTAAEHEILELLQQGLSNKEIAARRSRSIRTIANQVAALLRKTSTGSRRALVASIPTS